MIRLAKRADKVEFMALQQLLIEDLHRRGGAVLLTPKTMSLLGGMFDAYVEGEQGVVLVDERQAIVATLMWGSPGAEMDSEYGKLAVGYGTYVAPGLRGEGIATALWDAAEKILKDLGFDTIMIEPYLFSKDIIEILDDRGYHKTNVVMVRSL